VVILNRETVNLANLLGGEYGSHEGMIAETKSAARTARLPAAAPTIRFSRISNLYFQYARLSRKFQKKFLEQAKGLFQNQERSTLSLVLYRDRSPNVAATDVLTLIAHSR